MGEQISLVTNQYAKEIGFKGCPARDTEIWGWVRREEEIQAAA
jgi:hypothetical protein